MPGLKIFETLQEAKAQNFAVLTYNTEYSMFEVVKTTQRHDGKYMRALAFAKPSPKDLLTAVACQGRNVTHYIDLIPPPGG